MIERFFDWFYGRLGDAAKAIGEAAVRQARQPKAEPEIRVKTDLEVARQLVLWRPVHEAIGAELVEVLRNAYDDGLRAILRCPLCKRAFEAPISESGIRAAAIADSGLSYTVARAKFIIDTLGKAADAHRCQLELA